MGGTVSFIADAISRIYQNFVVRDLLGYVLPGSILILTFWIYIGCPRPHENRSIFEAMYTNIIYLDYKNNIDTKCTNIFIYLSRVIQQPKIIPTIVFLVASYTATWIIQCIHYSLINIFCILFLRKNINKNRLNTKSFITMMALKPDKISRKN